MSAADGPSHCPRCATPLLDGQDWCLECGAPARTRLAPTPNWRVPAAVVAVLVALAGGALAFAFVKLTDDAGPVATTPATAAPPGAQPAAPAPGATAPTPTPTPAPGATAPAPTPAPDAMAPAPDAMAPAPPATAPPEGGAEPPPAP